MSRSQQVSVVNVNQPTDNGQEERSMKLTTCTLRVF